MMRASQPGGRGDWIRTSNLLLPNYIFFDPYQRGLPEFLFCSVRFISMGYMGCGVTSAKHRARRCEKASDYPPGVIPDGAERRSGIQ